MTQNLLTDLGEEYLIKNGLDTASVSVGLYDDSTDNLSDDSDVDAITTEPSNANYAQATVTFSAADIAGNWGVDNDASFSFDFSDIVTTQSVDTAFLTVSFTAEDTADASSTTHLIGNPGLSQSRDIGSVDSIDIAVGDLSITVD